MTQHIGIVGCSAEGASLCYRTVNIEGGRLMGKHYHPEVSMHTYPLGMYMEHIYNNNWDEVAQLMAMSAVKLAMIGADFAICPDNTIHQAFDEAVRRSPIPWLHIAEEVAKAAKEQGFKKLGVLGTRYLMEGPVYPEKLDTAGILHVTPGYADRLQINEIIFEELVNGIFTDTSRRYFGEVIENLKKDGCDAVVLGCTEIPLIVDERNSSLPTLDSTRLLARAAVRKAMVKQAQERK